MSTAISILRYSQALLENSDPLPALESTYIHIANLVASVVNDAVDGLVEIEEEDLIFVTKEDEEVDPGTPI